MGTPGLQEVDHHGSVFTDLVTLAQRRAAEGRYRSALQWCRTAAGFATTNPVGVLRSTELEQVVDAVAAAVPDPRSGTPRLPPATGRRVLHVLSEAAPIGGLTRLVERWIQHDVESASSILLTRQSTVSERLQSTVRTSGGAAFGLADHVDAMERASFLRGVGHEVDLVICHLQSDDVVAAVAFGHGYRGAPVAFINHGDHIFWLAPTQAQLVVSNRDIAVELSHRVRGYAESSNQVLPLVIPDRHIHSTRQQTRSELGVVSDRPLAVSVARAVKFQDTDLMPRFSDVVSAMLERVPDLMFCAVGPEPSDAPWPELRRRFGSRVVVTGPVPDPQPYLDAADVYVDPFPFSSTTSLLEASAHSLAVITLDGHQGWRKMLGIPTFVGQVEDRPTSIGALTERVALLARDTGSRSESARVAREVYEGYYDAAQWPSDVERMYEKLVRLKDQDSTLGASTVPPPDAELLDYCAALWAIEQRTPLLWTVMANHSGFDRRDRLEWSGRCGLARLLARWGWTRAAERILRPVLPAAPRVTPVSDVSRSAVPTGATT